MHARELVELAAVVSAEGSALVRGPRRLSAASLEQYWTASKCRLDRWGRSLKAFAAEQDGPHRRHDRWARIRGMLEEILTGEILTRVWAAVLSAHDRHHGENDAASIAHGVMLGHLEARHRALTLLVASPDLSAEEAFRLNALRRRSERWTDVLVGHMAEAKDVSQFAVNPDRARQVADDLQFRGQPRGSEHVWPLLLASLRSAFAQRLCRVSPNADLNAAIASSIVSCFEPGFSDPTGLFHSLWLTRLVNLTDDAERLVDGLLAANTPEADRVSLSAGHLRRFGI